MHALVLVHAIRDEVVLSLGSNILECGKPCLGGFLDDGMVLSIGNRSFYRRRWKQLIEVRWGEMSRVEQVCVVNRWRRLHRR